MSKYTPYSELKIFHHIDNMNQFLKGERPAPIYLRIKPTNICNQKCFYCGYADDKVFDGRKVQHKESIPWSIMKKTISDMKEIGVKAVTFSGGGEPLCYPYILETLRMVMEENIDYSMITNGQALQGEAAKLLQKAKWVRISFDSANKDTYEGIRRVNTFDQILANIANFANAKMETCTLGINCVVTQNNANEIFDICKLVKELGADNIKLSPIMIKTEEESYHNAIKDSVMGQIKEAKIKLEDETFHIVDKYSNDAAIEDDYRKEYSKCHIQNFFAVIAADSKVYRCHQRAYMEVGELGDLTKQSFKEIWYSQETIDKVNDFNPQNDCCFRCVFDERNKLLDDFINIDRNHVNFI
jgi:radical SAM protein with 4Fe4S-binding SPASM domain